jgi:hypothetical protein
MAIMLIPHPAPADGIVIDRVYDPYVQPLETELEWRSIIQSDDTLGDKRKHFLGVGRSLSDRWAVELYAIGIKDSGASFSINTYELEFKWQLTEQGEYAFDWGMVFELERKTDEDFWEVAAILVSTRDFGRWTASANFGVIYEWGNGVVEEFETEMRLQARYRFKETIEPAVELHIGQDTVALGPAITGLGRLSPGKKLRWELGVFWGLDEHNPRMSYRPRTKPSTLFKRTATRPYLTPTPMLSGPPD